MSEIVTHYIALVIGGCVGFMAAVVLSAGKRREYTPMIVHCRDCKHARTETHKGDSELVCWRHATHGETVRPLDFCSRGTQKEVDNGANRD